jgi:hypothetical protein
VITAWSHEAPPADALGSAKFKVGRLASGEDTFTVVGESPLKTIVSGQLNTFTDLSISVQPGDVIGLFIPPNGPGMCGRDGDLGYVEHVGEGDVPPGATATFQTAPIFFQLDVSARLEPDADRDGFGDETQDACPTDATKQGDCDPPETTITKDAPKRIDTDSVKFRFASSEVDSTFECKLKGKDLKRRIRQFGDCDSPRKYKSLDEGRYRFKVRAIDAAGNVDLTPAEDRFRVLD